MTRNRILLLVVAGAVFMALGIATGYYAKRHFAKADLAERQASSTVAKPEHLPEFTLYDLDGKPVTRDALLAHDKALFINFWATWCKPCREEMPLLTEMQAKYVDDLVMVGVAIDNPEAVASFLQQLGGVNYPILLGERELDAIETANAMGIDLIGLPVSVITDRTGRILDVHTGEVDAAEAEALINQAL